MKKFLLIFAFFFLLFAIFPQPASAELFQKWENSDCVDQVPSNEPGKPPAEVPTLRCLPVVFHNAVSGLLIFVGVFAMFMIIYSGIRLVTSGGDPKQVDAARKIMNYAIIGVIVVLSSFTILYFIGFLTNSTDCITNINAISTGGCK